MRNIEELIDNLRGTCKSLDKCCEYTFGISSDELTVEELARIDDSIFLCDECGWWYEISDMSENEGEQICNDCHDEG